MVSPKAGAMRRATVSPFKRPQSPPMSPSKDSLSLSGSASSIQEPLLTDSPRCAVRRGLLFEAHPKQAPLFGASNAPSERIPLVPIVLIAGLLILAFGGGMALAGMGPSKRSHDLQPPKINPAGEHFPGMDPGFLVGIEEDLQQGVGVVGDGRDLINEGVVTATAAAAAVPAVGRAPSGRKARMFEEPKQAEDKSAQDMEGVHEKELQFMKAARKLSDAEDEDLKLYISEAFDTFNAAMEAAPEKFQEAQHALFGTILESPEATGALVWMLAHWELNRMPKDWREWTEINIARGSKQEEIVKVYREQLPDREGVDGIAKTFEMWKKYSWRLSVPGGQEHLAAHSEASAKRAREMETIVESIMAEVAAEGGGDAAPVAEKPMDMITMHERELSFMNQEARETTDAEDEEIRSALGAMFAKYRSVSDKEGVTQEELNLARRELFDGVLQSEDVTGALLWMLAHWHLNKMPESWRDWTELNIARKESPLKDIVGVYRDTMTDPQGVKGMIELFDEFQKNRWRFSIGQRVPPTEKKEDE